MRVGISGNIPIWGMRVVIGDPGRIRTPDLLIRSQLLYPAELRDPNSTSITERRILATGKRHGGVNGSRAKTGLN